MDTAAQHGIRFTLIPRVSNQAEGINAVRLFLPVCWFAEPTLEDMKAEGGEQRAGVDRVVDCLDNYRKEWDEKLGVFREQPRHDWASHGAKAFETLARSNLFAVSTGTPAAPTQPTSPRKRWGAHT